MRWPTKAWRSSCRRAPLTSAKDSLPSKSAAMRRSKVARKKTMDYDDIIYEVAERTATITLNRPNQLNALSPHMIGELRHAYAAAEADPDVWTILVTGNGRAFC